MGSTESKADLQVLERYAAQLKNSKVTTVMDALAGLSIMIYLCLQITQAAHSVVLMSRPLCQSIDTTLACASIGSSHPWTRSERRALSADDSYSYRRVLSDSLSCLGVFNALVAATRSIWMSFTVTWDCQGQRFRTKSSVV